MNKKAKKFDYVLAVIFVFLVIITIYPFLNVLAISFNDSTDTIKTVSYTHLALKRLRIFSFQSHSHPMFSEYTGLPDRSPEFQVLPSGSGCETEIL